LADHFSPLAQEAESRWDKGEYWWELRTCDYYQEFERPKIIYLVFQVKPTFTFDNSGFYVNNAVWMIPKEDKYLLGLLNSKIGWFLISQYCTRIQNGYQLIFQYLGKIPIRPIDFSNPADKARHDKMVTLVERMLSLNKQRADVKIDHDKNLVERQIEATDKQIDALVYDLYGLTSEEIQIVERGTK